jgi:hypothetical protein
MYHGGSVAAEDVIESKVPVMDHLTEDDLERVPIPRMKDIISKLFTGDTDDVSPSVSAFNSSI